MTDKLNRRQVLASAAVAGVALPHVAGRAADRRPQGNFIWGVSSSAAQTESRAGRGRSNWDVFADTPGKIKDGSTTAHLTEFDTRYAQDLDFLKAADIPAFRLSMAWPRVQPDSPGKPSAGGLDLYDRILDAMQERGIEPWVTMFHWDIPVWAGDFRSRDIAYRMADYARILVERFGDRVKRWIVLNEPNSVSTLGYGTGIHAPGLTSAEAMMAAIHHQNLALGLMTRVAKEEVRPGTLIGTTHAVAPVRPETASKADAVAALTVDNLWKWAFLDPLFNRGYPAALQAGLEPLIKPGDMDVIHAPIDFLGINYYSSIYIAAADNPLGLRPGEAPPEFERTDYFPVDPAGLTEALVSMKTRYGNIPIYITEIGFALTDEPTWHARINDARRSAYLEKYLIAAASARQQGVDLRGVFYWGATDNWEWADGFTKRLGMIAVDPVTQRRAAKKSLARYAGQIRTHFPDSISRTSKA